MRTKITYPLIWPENKPRKRRQKPSKYRDPDIQASINLIEYTAKAMKLQNVILSTNLKINNWGDIYGRANNEGSGASLQFSMKGRHYILACDKYMKVKENIHAVAKSLDHYRWLWANGVIAQPISVSA